MTQEPKGPVFRIVANADAPRTTAAEDKRRWVGATVRLPADERAALVAAARDHGGITTVIREAVKFYLAESSKRQETKPVR